MARSTLALALALACACVERPPEPPPAASDDGELVDAVVQATVTRDELVALVPAEIVVDNGYTVYAISYRTQGTDATATVTLPDSAAPPGGFPLVANAHGTIGLDDPCRLSGTIAGAGLAALFGARRAVGVAPDYLGLGGPGLHPYLHVESEGRAVLDALRAARALAEREGISASTRVAVVGLSQGGHAALATGAVHQGYAPELELRAVGAAAPASGYREHWSAIGLSGPHQLYYAMLSYAFATEAGLAAAELFAPGIAADVDALFATRCAWSPSFNADEPLLSDALPEDPRELYRDDARAAFRGEVEAAWADDGFATRRLPAFTTSAAVRVWQGDADETVLAEDTVELVRALREGGLDVELTLVPDAGHLDTAFGFLASLDRARAESVAWVLAALGDLPSAIAR
ncbi:MAG: hypothetical protein IT383_27665 [Deltaproteobacteria bacterium]|nr:hypothetical protein [Deltaproteobacteria bacterium]